MIPKLKAGDINFNGQRVISIEGDLAFAQCDNCGLNYTILVDDFAGKVCDSPKCIKNRGAR